MASDPSKTICVTGASGFIAAQIVSQLLEGGYTVKGTVRNPDDPAKVDHLKSLPGAAERLQLFKADLDGTPGDGRFDAAVAGCGCVMHTATPVILSGATDGKAQIYDPAMGGTEEVMNACEKAGTVKCFVLTSSMSACAPQPEPEVKTEEHWSDDAAQEAKGNWYGCTKTRQEKFCQNHALVTSKKMRFVAILPTGVFGPMLQPSVNATNGWIAMLGAKGREANEGKAQNDSMSFVDVRDCAKMHIVGYEKEAAEGRFMCIAGTPKAGDDKVFQSLHWNDIFKILKENVPTMPDVADCDGEPVCPTQFDLTKMQTLIKVEDMRPPSVIIADAVKDLKRMGKL